MCSRSGSLKDRAFDLDCNPVKVAPRRSNFTKIILRAKRVLNIIKNRAEENVRLGLVTHGAFISSFLSLLFNLNIADGIAFQSHNCSISRLTFERNKKVTIQYLNFYSYLPENLRVPRPDLNLENG